MDMRHLLNIDLETNMFGEGYTLYTTLRKEAFLDHDQSLYNIFQGLSAAAVPGVFWPFFCPSSPGEIPEEGHHDDEDGGVSP